MGETESTETALAIHQPAALSGYIPPPGKAEFEAMISMANTLAKAQGFLPAHFFGQPYKILAAILYGRDLGISATNALQHIIVIEGKATADAQLIGMLVRRAGHRLEDKTTDQSSTVTITRDDGSIHTVTFTMADAQRAGLVRPGGAWTKYPSAMLYARALTACARKGAQDALMGTVYTPEEVGAEIDDNGDVKSYVGSPPSADITVDGEILNPSAASLEAVQARGNPAPPPPSGSTPAAAADTQGSAAARQGESSPPPQASGSAGAAVSGPSGSVEPPKSGPRAKKGNVVTAPRLHPSQDRAPLHMEAEERGQGAREAIDRLEANQPVGPVSIKEGVNDLKEMVEGLKAKAAKRDGKPAADQDGITQYTATLREGIRESAAILRQLGVRQKNAKGGESLPIPEAAPSTESDESLAAFIASAQNDKGKLLYPDKTLATLELKELEAVGKVLEDAIVAVKAKLK